MPSKEILQKRNCIHITVISYFHLQLLFRSLSLQILGIKLVKLGCIIMYLDLDTIKMLEISWIEPVACLLFNVSSKICPILSLNMSCVRQ